MGRSYGRQRQLWQSREGLWTLDSFRPRSRRRKGEFFAVSLANFAVWIRRCISQVQLTLISRICPLFNFFHFSQVILVQGLVGFFCVGSIFAEGAKDVFYVRPHCVGCPDTCFDCPPAGRGGATSSKWVELPLASLPGHCLVLHFLFCRGLLWIPGVLHPWTLHRHCDCGEERFNDQFLYIVEFVNIDVCNALCIVYCVCVCVCSHDYQFCVS